MWITWPIASAATALTLGAAPALAGAWARGEGNSFISLSYTSTSPRTGGANPYLSIFAEYGLRPRWTLGLDAGGDPKQETWQAITVTRYTITPPEAVNQWSVEIGGGARDTGGGPEPMLRPGLSWGRGLTIGSLGGWTAIDARVEYGVSSGQTLTKIDATFGLRPSDRSFAILQLQGSDLTGRTPTLKLAPSYVRKLGATRLEVGGIFGLAGTDEFGVKLGTWLEF